MTLDRLFSKENVAYMAHVYYGDPCEEFSIELIKTLCKSGVDIIEFGIPFSDPTADGPVFQRACERAIKMGMTPKKAINGIKKLRYAGLKQPIVVTSYYNPIFYIGVNDFVKKIKSAGADALLVPNVPFEESDPLLAAGEKHGIDIIFLVAPTTPEKRLKEILKRAKGFVYIVTTMGVTGTRENLQNSTLELVKRVRKYTDIPLLAGFGISKKEHVKSVILAGANGVITGSVLGKIYEKNLKEPSMTLSELETFSYEIKQSCIEAYKERLEVPTTNEN